MKNKFFTIAEKKKQQQTLGWLLDFDWLLIWYDYLILTFQWFISVHFGVPILTLMPCLPYYPMYMYKLTYNFRFKNHLKKSASTYTWTKTLMVTEWAEK